MNKKIKSILFSLVLRLILNIVFVTCKFKTIGLREFDFAINNNRPVLLCLWHEHLLCVSRYFKNSPLNLYGVSSTHFDSEILAKTLSSWKIKLIRGSSTRGWVGVLKKMIVLFKKNSSVVVALTNDGPKGPARVAKEGSLSVAKKYNAQIISVSAFVLRRWRLNSWDRTIIPKPFSTIIVKFSEPYPDNKDITSSLVTEFISLNECEKNV